MMDSFLSGIAIMGAAGSEHALSVDDVLKLLAVYLDEDNESPGELATSVAEAVIDRIEEYVAAGGTADGLPWGDLLPVERQLVVEAMTRQRNLERSLLALQIGRSLGSEVAYAGVTNDDEELATLRAKGETMHAARRGGAKGLGGE